MVTPDDAPANPMIARYRALITDDWPEAISVVRQVRRRHAGEARYASAAGAADSAAQSVLGDQWWDAAQVAKPAERPELLPGAD